MTDKRPSCAKGRGYEYLGRKLFASIIKKHETSPSAEYLDDIEHEETIHLPNVDRSSFIYGSGGSKKTKSSFHDLDDDLIESNLGRRGSVGSFFMPNSKQNKENSTSVTIDPSYDTDNLISKLSEPAGSTKKIIKTITKTSETTETRRASYFTKQDPDVNDYTTYTKTVLENETYTPAPPEINKVNPNYKSKSSILSHETNQKETHKPNYSAPNKDKDENKIAPIILKSESKSYEHNDINVSKPPSFRKTDKNETDPYHSVKHDNETNKQTRSHLKNNADTENDKDVLTSQTISFERHETQGVRRPSQMKTKNESKTDEFAHHHLTKPIETSVGNTNLENGSLNPGTSYEKQNASKISKRDDKELKRHSNNDENDINIGLHPTQTNPSIRNLSQGGLPENRFSKSGIPMPLRGADNKLLEKNRPSVVKPNVQVEAHNIKNLSLSKSDEENKTNRFGYPAHTKDNEENQLNKLGSQSTRKPSNLVETNNLQSSFLNKSGAFEAPSKVSINSQINNKGEINLDKGKLSFSSKHDDENENKEYIKISPENTLMEKITRITPYPSETSEVVKLAPDLQERKKLLNLLTTESSISTNRQESLNNHLIIKGSSHLSEAPKRLSLESNENKRIICDNTDVVNLLNKLLDEVTKISDFNMQQSKASPVCHFYTDPKLELHKSQSKDLDKSYEGHSSINFPNDINTGPNISSAILKLINNVDENEKAKVSRVDNIDGSMRLAGSMAVTDARQSEKTNFNELLNNQMKKSVSSENPEIIDKSPIQDQIAFSDFNKESQRTLGSIVGTLNGVDRISHLKPRLSSIIENDISQDRLTSGSSSKAKSDEIDKSRMSELLDQVQKNPSLLDNIGNSQIRDKLISAMFRNSLDPRGSESYRIQSINDTRAMSIKNEKWEPSKIIHDFNIEKRGLSLNPEKTSMSQIQDQIAFSDFNKESQLALGSIVGTLYGIDSISQLKPRLTSIIENDISQDRLTSVNSSKAQSDEIEKSRMSELLHQVQKNPSLLDNIGNSQIRDKLISAMFRNSLDPRGSENHRIKSMNDTRGMSIKHENGELSNIINDFSVDERDLSQTPGSVRMSQIQDLMTTSDFNKESQLALGSIVGTSNSVNRLSQSKPRLSSIIENDTSQTIAGKNGLQDRLNGVNSSIAHSDEIEKNRISELLEQVQKNPSLLDNIGNSQIRDRLLSEMIRNSIDPRGSESYRIQSMNNTSGKSVKHENEEFSKLINDFSVEERGQNPENVRMSQIQDRMTFSGFNKESQRAIGSMLGTSNGGNRISEFKQRSGSIIENNISQTEAGKNGLQDRLNSVNNSIAHSDEIEKIRISELLDQVQKNPSLFDNIGNSKIREKLLSEMIRNSIDPRGNESYRIQSDTCGKSIKHENVDLSKIINGFSIGPGSGQNQINQLENILKCFNGKPIDGDQNVKDTLQQLMNIVDGKDQLHDLNWEKGKLNISEDIGRSNLDDIIDRVNVRYSPNQFETDRSKYGRKSNNVQDELQERIHNISLQTNSMTNFDRNTIDQLLNQSYKNLYNPASGLSLKVPETNLNQEKDRIQQLIKVTAGKANNLNKHLSSNEENEMASDFDFHARNKVQEFLMNDKSEIEKFINGLTAVANNPTQIHKFEPGKLINIITKLSQDLGISDGKKVQELLNVVGKKTKGPIEKNEMNTTSNSDPRNFVISENQRNDFIQSKVSSNDEQSDLCGPGIDSDEPLKFNTVNKKSYESCHASIERKPKMLNEIEKPNCSQLLETNRIYQILTNLNGKQSHLKSSNVSKDCKNLIYEYSLKEIPLNIIIDYVQDKLSTSQRHRRPNSINDNSTTGDLNNVWSKSHMSDDIPSSKKVFDKLDSIDKRTPIYSYNVDNEPDTTISDKKRNSCLKQSNKKVEFRDLERLREDVQLDAYHSNIKLSHDNIVDEPKSDKDQSMQIPLQVPKGESLLQDNNLIYSKVCQYCYKYLDPDILPHQHYDCPSLGIKSIPCYCRHNVPVPRNICNSEPSITTYCLQNIPETHNSIPESDNEETNIPIYSNMGKKVTLFDEDGNDDTEQLMQLCRKYLNKKTKVQTYKTVESSQKSENLSPHLVNSSDYFHRGFNIPTVISKVETIDKYINTESKASDKHKESSCTTINTEFKSHVPSENKKIVNMTQNCFSHKSKIPGSACKDRYNECDKYKSSIGNHTKYRIDGYNNNVSRHGPRSNLWANSLITYNSKIPSLTHKNCEGSSSLFLKNPQSEISCESLLTSECDSKLLVNDCYTQTNNQRKIHQSFKAYPKDYHNKIRPFPPNLFKHESSQANFPNISNRYNFQKLEIPTMYNSEDNLRLPYCYRNKKNKEFSQQFDFEKSTKIAKYYFFPPLTNELSHISSEESHIHDDPIPYCISTNKQIITSNRAVQANNLKHHKGSQQLSSQSIDQEHFHYVSSDYDTPIFKAKEVMNEVFTNFPEYNSTIRESLLTSPSSHLYFDVKPFINRSSNNLLSKIVKQSKSTETLHANGYKPINFIKLINKFTQCSSIATNDRNPRDFENVYGEKYFSNTFHSRSTYENSLQKKEIKTRKSHEFQNIRKKNETNPSKDSKTAFTNSSTLLITSPRQLSSQKSFSTQIRLIPLDSQRFCCSFQNQEGSKFSIATQTLSVSVCSISDCDISSRSELASSSTDENLSGNFGRQSNLYKFSSDSIIV